MDVLGAVQVVGGLVLLVAGGESLVRGAASLARRIGMSSLVVGLTVVAFATSAPELAVTLDAVLGGEPDLAVGNVVGSNIANVLLVLGASAVLLPLAVTAQVVRVDLPVMLGLSGLLLVVALDGRIGALDGLLLLAVLAGYTVLAVVLGRRNTGGGHVETSPEPTTPEPTTPGHRPDEDAPPTGTGSRGRLSAGPDLVLVAVGVGLLVLGANLLVDGAVAIASSFGVSSLVIGLTVVAAGTSLPELVTSLVAARRGERDMAVGNVVGSNIFNIGLVLGLPALIGGAGIPVPPAAIALDLPLMIAASLALLPVAFTGFRIARWEGALFLGLYVAYMAYVLLAAAGHDALDGFTGIMLSFVLPLVGVTLVATAAYDVGRRRGAGEPLI